MRLLSSLGHYLATAGEGGIQIHQYASADLAVESERGSIAIEMTSDYPWSGQVTLAIRETGVQEWELALRIPAWCTAYRLFLNGNRVVDGPIDNGYLRTSRRWQPGDRIVLEFDMPPQFIAPDPRIDAVRGSLAVQRGPLIYCVETHDQPSGTRLSDVEIDASATPSAQWDKDLLGGMVTLGIPGHVGRSQGWNENLYLPAARAAPPERRPLVLTAIPYFAWGNRGLESMRVWLPAAG